MKAYVLNVLDGSLEYSYDSSFLINSTSISADGSSMVIGGDASTRVFRRIGWQNESSVKWINQVLIGVTASVLFATVIIVFLARRKFRRS